MGSILHFLLSKAAHFGLDKVLTVLQREEGPEALKILIS